MEFQNEQKDREEKFQKLYNQAEDEFDNQQEKDSDGNIIQKDIEDFQEDWNLSQFWYSKETATLLAQEALRAIGVNTQEQTNEKYTIDYNGSKKLAIISAPSVYSALLALLKPCINAKDILQNVYLLEFDSRFRLLTHVPANFIHYDYNKPLNIPKSLKGQFDAVVVDPPFLSEECHTKTALTARFFLKNPLKAGEKTESKVIVCTGERVSEVIQKVYPGIHITDYFPEHANGLSNEFRCYSNFECPSWKFSS